MRTAGIHKTRLSSPRGKCADGERKVHAFAANRPGAADLHFIAVQPRATGTAVAQKSLRGIQGTLHANRARVEPLRIGKQCGACEDDQGTDSLPLRFIKKQDASAPGDPVGRLYDALVTDEGVSALWDLVIETTVKAARNGIRRLVVDAPDSPQVQTLLAAASHHPEAFWLLVLATGVATPESEPPAPAAARGDINAE